jgi:hypothetical protein
MFYIIDRVLTRYERLAKLHSSQTLQSICKSLGHGTFSTKDGVFVRDESVSVFHSSQTLQSDLEMLKNGPFPYISLLYMGLLSRGKV